MKKKIWIPVGIIMLLALGLIIVYNFRKNGFAFLETSIVELLTLAVTCFVTFYITEYLNDKRRRNDCIEHVIIEIAELVFHENIFDANKGLLLQQSCANKIKYLRDANFKDIDADLKDIQDHFQEIRDIFSNHYQKEEGVEAVRPDLSRHQSVISDKCDKIRISLYQ